MHPDRRPFAKNILWAFMGRGGVMIAGFAATALLTRLLSPHDVGTYYLILGIALAASPLANLSLDEPVIRAVAVARGTGNTARAVAFVYSSLKLAVLSSLVTFVLIVVLWGTYQRFGYSGPARWIVLSTLAGAWTAIFAMERQLVATLQGMEEISSAALYDLALGRVLSCIVLFILWVFAKNTTIVEVLAVYISCEAASLAGAAWSARRSVRKLGPTDISVSWREILASSWPYTVQVVTTAVGNQAGIFVLGATHSVRDVAVYSIAARLSNLLNTPGTIVNVPLAPMIAKLHSQNERTELQEILQAAATIPTVISVVATVWWAFDGQRLLGIIFGAPYSLGASALLILSVSQCANLYFGPSLLTLSMSGEQSLAMKLGLVGMLAQITAVLSLTRYWGINGVALGILISTVLAKVGGWYAIRSKFGIKSQASIRSMSNVSRQVFVHMKSTHPESTK